MAARIVDTIRHGAPAHDEVPSAPPEPRRKGAPELGVVQYFHKGDRTTVESVLRGAESLPMRNLRTAISWCDWLSAEGEDWYRWLLPQLKERFHVLPCFLYTPPSLGILPKTSSPPRDPQAYGEFVEMVLREEGEGFTHVELWNEPNNYIEWDWTIDPEWKIFAEMIAGAARRASALGVKSVLGGMSPFDPNWLDLMFKRGALEHVDVIGVHGFPGTWEAVWEGWDTHIGRVQEVLDRHDGKQTVWVTEAGFSTWAHDEFRQLRTTLDLAEAPAERVYWYSVEDLAPERETLDGFHCDERAYHFGLQRRGGAPKLLARVLARRGLDGVREMVQFASQPASARHERGAALITGGAGFIGTNLADRLASSGRPVTVLDSLARAGVENNLRWLKRKHGDLVRVEVGDVRDVFAVRRALSGAERVFHLAAQVDVDASLRDPVGELGVNLQGTMNVLEEIRGLEERPALVFASTSHVYGRLIGGDPPETGVTESQRLDLVGPHACSKGAAEHYVLDYARSFGLRTCALRMSCIYGRGGQDQGWVARFMRAALRDEPITIFGHGRQLRDLLHVVDLVDALVAVSTNRVALTGRAFNVGGGPHNVATPLEVVDAIAAIIGARPEVRFAEARRDEPDWYVSDNSALSALTGWHPRVAFEEGIEWMHSWLEKEVGALPASRRVEL